MTAYKEASGVYVAKQGGAEVRGSTLYNAINRFLVLYK